MKKLHHIYQSLFAGMLKRLSTKTTLAFLLSVVSYCATAQNTDFYYLTNNKKQYLTIVPGKYLVEFPNDTGQQQQWPGVKKGLLFTW